MKFHSTKLALLALPLAASVLLASCVSNGHRDVSQGEGGGRRLPATASPSRDYSGINYYHRKRYYVGGRYETGRYVHEGRSYTNRYLHNGQYLYGGYPRDYPSDGSGQIHSRRSSGAGYVSDTTPPRTQDRQAFNYGRR